MKYFILILVCFFIYLFFVFPLIGRPLLIDEITMAAFAMVPWSFGNLGPAGHPPFYVDILRLISQVFGVYGGGFRLIGIICFLLNLFLIYQLSRKLSNDNKVGLIACLIFSLHPMAIHGSMILDIDNTILTVLLTMTLLYFIENSKKLNLRNGIFLTLLFFSCLWAKLSTPFILMGSLVLFQLLNRDKIKAAQISVISIVAVSIFILIWKIGSVVFDYHFSVVFRRCFSVLTADLQLSSLSVMQKLAVRILRLFLWFGPYLLLFWIVDIIKRFKFIILKREQLKLNDLLIIYSAGVFISYLFVGGTIFGFAKYHYPMLPILSILLANSVISLDLRSFKKYFILYGICGVVFLFVSNIISGDLLFQVNYILRKTAIFSPQQLPVFYKDFVKRMIFYFLPFISGIFVIRLLTRKESWFRIFGFMSITFIIIDSLALDIYLRNAQFFTTYCYGRDVGEFKRVAKLCEDIAGKNKTAKIIAPEDILYDARIPVWVGYEELWNNRDRFIKTIEDSRVKAVIYGFTYNAVFSYRHIFLDPSVLSVLKSNFTPLESPVFQHGEKYSGLTRGLKPRVSFLTEFTQDRAGEYTIWVRK